MNLGSIKLLLVGPLVASLLSIAPAALAVDAAHASLPPGFGSARPGRVASVKVTPGGYSILGGKQAALSWSRAPGATSYQVASRLMADASSPWNLIPYRVKTTSMTLQPFLIGRRYEFRVQPYNSAGAGAATVSAVTRMKGLPARRMYAALGDSYSSGLGSGGSESGGDCHRSAKAWAFELQRTLQRRTQVFACAGAVVADVAKQIGPMRSFFATHPESPQLVTVTVGGNDAGFADVLQSCATGRCEAKEASLRARISRIRSPLTSLYRRIRAAGPYADVIAGGYPQVLEPMGTSANLLCKFITSTERLMLSRLSTELNRTIATAAGDAGIWSVGQQVRMEFNGHNACANPSQEWINAGTLKLGGIAGLLSPKTFHPKDVGQHAFADAFNEALLARSA